MDDVLGMKHGLHYLAEVIDLLNRRLLQEGHWDEAGAFLEVNLAWLEDFRGLSTLTELTGDPFAHSRHKAQALIARYVQPEGQS